MKMKDKSIGILRKVWIISMVLLLLSLAIPAPNNVVSETTIVSIDLKAGWNVKSMPRSISASDLALKSNYIKSIVYRSTTGYYVTYIPSLGATDFTCEINEAVYIYSEADTTITFTLSTSTEYISEDLIVTGDLDVIGDSVFGKNLTVKGSMSVMGNLAVNSLNVSENLIVDGNLTVHEDLKIGENLTVNGDLIVGKNFLSNEAEELRSEMISAIMYLTIKENLIVRENLTVYQNLMVGKNLTVNEYLTVGKDLTVDENLMVGRDLTVNENLTVGKNLIVNENLIVVKDLSVNGNIITGKDLTVNENVIVGRNLNVNEYLTVGKDLTVNENLTVGKDLIVGNITITEDMTYSGNLTVLKDLTADGSIIVIGDATIGGNLTVMDDIIIEGDYTITENLTVGGDLLVKGNITGLGFTNTADFIIFKDDTGLYYAKNGYSGEIESQSDDASFVFNQVIEKLKSKETGGKIYFKAGRYNFSEPLIIEGVTEVGATITIEGSGYWRATKLYLMSPTVLPTFISLKGSRFIQLRNLQLEVNKKANYGIRMERDETLQPAGDHILENVYITNARQVGLLSYGSENLLLENVYARYGNPVGMMITAFPPTNDPTVIGAMPVNTSGQPRSTLHITMINCKWGEASTTTRTGLILYRTQVSIFGGLSMIRQDAEANFIIDETLNQVLIDGVHIDLGPDVGFRIGHYPSVGQYHSTLTITGLTVRNMNGTSIIDAERLSGSTIMGVVTTEENGVITLGSTTRRNFISGFTRFTGTTPGGEYNIINDYGIDNIIQQKNYINRGVAMYITDGTWISHGLASTPTIVILTPRSNAIVWVNARNETQFQIGVSSGTVTVDWYVEV